MVDSWFEIWVFLLVQPGRFLMENKHREGWHFVLGLHECISLDFREILLIAEPGATVVD